MAKDNLPYPLQFDPSQWSNQFSLFNNQALPWPPSYVGTPTDALGNPIQAPQGTTLTSTPFTQPQAAPQQAATNLMPGQATGPGSYKYFTQGGIPSFYAANADKGSQGEWDMNPYSFARQQPQQAAAPQAAAPTAANNWNQTLAMLANPGHVTTQGANVPQSQFSGGPQPGVLQHFLQNWQPAQSGPGAGFQQNFNSILRGLQGT